MEATVENAPIGKSRPHFADTTFKISLHIAGAIVIIVLAAILLIMFIGGRQAFETFGVGFIWSSEWNPVTHVYGALPAITGTLVTAFVAVIIAWPVGFGIAFFLTETCPRQLRTPLGIAIELLAAIPSIVYGMWGVFVLAPFMAENVQPWLTETFAWIPPIGDSFFWFSAPPLGVGLMTASLVLAIMILPFIAATTRDVLLDTPDPERWRLRYGRDPLGSAYRSCHPGRTWFAIRCCISRPRPRAWGNDGCCLRHRQR